MFDFHARLVPRPGAAAALLSTMDSAGVRRAVLSAGGVVTLERLSAQILDGGHSEAEPDNGAVLAACAGSGGRLLPCYFASPYADPHSYRAQVSRYRGLELSPAVHGVGLDDPRTGALVAIAAQARHPVYVVCLGRAGARTADLVRLARRFPDTTFVSGHCGAIGIDASGIGQIAAVPNIVAETSGCFTAIARLALHRLGPDRVLFGTEYPLQHPSVELAKYAALDLPAPVWRQVAWHNAHRLLGEEPR